MFEISIISKERLSFKFNQVEARGAGNMVNQPLKFKEIIENKDFE